MDSFEYSGVWWIPTKRERQIAGKLSYTPADGGVLELVDAIDLPDLEYESTQSEVEGGTSTSGRFKNKERSKELFDFTYFISEHEVVIHGYVGNHIYVSLINCRRAGDMLGPHKTKGLDIYVLESKLEIEEIYVSNFRLFDQLTDLKFKRMQVRYTYLPDWLAYHSTMFQSDSVSTFSCTNDECFELQFRDESLKISFVRPSVFPSDVGEVVIEAQRAMHANSFLELIKVHIVDFLTLATSRDNFALHVTGYCEGKLPVQVYFGMRGYMNKPDEYLLGTEMLFTFEDVQNGLASYLSNWIKNREELSEIYRLYFMPYYQTTRDTGVVFLSLAQALEATHRKKFPESKHADKELHRKVIKKVKLFLKKLSEEEEIPEAVSDDYLERLENIIGSLGNEYSFKARILELLNDMASCGGTNDVRLLIDEIIGDDWSKFASRVRDTRDYLTHYFSRSSNVIPDEQLNHETHRLQLIVEIMLLISIEFDPVTVRNVVKNSIKHWRMKRTR